MKMIFKIIAGLFFLTCINSCQFGSKDTPDVTNLKRKVIINRFDNEFFKIDLSNIKSSLGNLNVRYPSFFDIFTQQVMYNNPDKALSVEENVSSFLRDSFILGLKKTCDTYYNDKIGPLSDEFSEAFAYLKYYFPDRNSPVVISYISAYNYAAFTVGEDTLAFNLDMFLGPNHYGYDPTLFPDYVKKMMIPSQIVPKTMKAYLQNMMIDPDDQRMLDLMIYNGKLLFALEKLLPNKSGADIHGYSLEQYEWCVKNEKEIWKMFVEKGLIYNRRMMDFVKFVTPSPTSPYMPKEAPGETGNFIGYKIVSEYMKKNPNITLENLLKDNNVEKILKSSKYRPT